MLQSCSQRDDRRTWFSRCAIWCVMVGLLLPTLSGCFGEKQRKARTNRAPGSAIEPDDITGRWKLTVANHGAKSDLALVQIDHDEKREGNKYSITVKYIGQEAKAPFTEISKFKISEDGNVEFDIGMSNFVRNFSGRLDGEAIWGSFLFPHFELLPAKLERTEENEVAIPKEQEYVSHSEDFMKALNSSDLFVVMESFTESANRSPLLFEAYEAMAMLLKKEKYSKEKTLEFIEKYRKAVDVWGPRLAPLVDLNMGFALAKTTYLPELAKSLLETADSKLTEEYPLEVSAKLVEAWIELGDSDKALNHLPKLQEKDPSNPNLLWLSARAKEKAKDNDAAMLAYTKVAAIPGFEMERRGPGVELPSASAIRLWKVKHGSSTEGFEEYYHNAYKEVMKTFVPQREPEKRDPDANVPLIELFTSIGCMPCIAADISAESIRHSYSNQEVVVVKFHQHVPYVDPLANDTSLKRAAYYGISGTPSMAFNGQVADQQIASASATGVSPILGTLRGMLEFESKKKTPVTIKVEANRTGDEIKIKADVAGIQSVDHQPKLYLVLVENEIRLLAPNGIQVHNCVARAFAGGVKGIDLKKGSSSHVETLSLSQLKKDLNAHLLQATEGREMPIKPMDFKKLQIVAFVQPALSRVVLQSVLADVIGDVPPDVAPEPKPETKTDAKPAPKPEPKADAKPEDKPAVKPEEKPAAKPEEKPADKPEPKASEPKASEPKATDPKTTDATKPQ